MKTVHLTCQCGAELRQTDLDHRVEWSVDDFIAQHCSTLCAVRDRIAEASPIAQMEETP